MSFIRRIATCTLVILSVSGCATSYDTQKSFWSFGKGFDITQIAEDSWQIGFVGNAQTDRALARKYMLRKAAELADGANYPYFILSSEQNNKDTVASGGLGFKSDDWLYSLGNIENETSVIVEVTGLAEKTEKASRVYDTHYILNKIKFDS